jgi:hypothetical protein
MPSPACDRIGPCGFAWQFIDNFEIVKNFTLSIPVAWRLCTVTSLIKGRHNVTNLL